jgi:5-methylcytosine-specific restriction endonuclease McrA
MKICTSCKIKKPLTDFTVYKQSKDGLMYQCKRCNSDRYLKWQKENAKKVNKRNCDWIKQHRELHNLTASMRRANKLKATPGWFEKEKVEIVFAKAKQWGFEVDHVIPLKHEKVCGLHCWTNLQLLDRRENAKKGNKFEIL